MLAAYGINDVHFGVIMVLNLMIGLLTPPFGLVLFVLSRIGKISVGRLAVVLLPWMGALLVALLLVTFIEPITMWLPTTLGLMG